MTQPDLTPAEACRLLRVTRNCVQAMVNAGKLTAYQVGVGTRHKHYRITRESFDKLRGEA